MANKDLAALANEAIMVQDACNLSGVVHGFSGAITQLRQLFPNEGTEFFNTHPITRLWVSKLYDLARLNTGVEAYEKYSDAYEACRKIVAGE